MARVVVLTGVSSAGKSSLAALMQARSDSDWLHVSLDQFISMVPNGRETSPEWFVVEDVSERSGHPQISFINGPRGARLMQSMRDFVTAAANRGLDVIVDDVCTRIEVDDYRKQLSGHDLTIVRVDVTLDEVERREKARGDRMIGLARQQFGRIHEGIEYDLTVRNGDGELDACARAILAVAGTPD